MKESFAKYLGSPIFWAGVTMSGGIAFINAFFRADTVWELLFNLTLVVPYAFISWFGVGLQVAGMWMEAG